MASENATVIDIIARLRDKTSPQLRSIQQNMNRFENSVRRTREQTARLTNDRHSIRLDAQDRATAAITRIAGGLKNVSGKTFHFTVKAIDFATKPLRTMFNMATSLKTLIAGIMAGMAGKKAILEPINLADNYTSAFIGFETLFKSTEKAQKMMDDLDNFAKETPFKTAGVIQNSQKMIAMGWNPDDMIKDMRTIGDAAAATGKGDQGFNSIVLALSQIKTKGKLSAEELNQLAEAGIRAKGYLSEQLGYGSNDAGMAQFTKDLEKGLIGSEKAIQALLAGMQEYNGMMDKTANETVQGLKSQIEDTFEISILRKWGQGLQDGAKKGMLSIVKLLNSSEEGLVNLGIQAQELGKEISNKVAGGLENVVQKLMKITDTAQFKNADLGGKFKIVWDELIVQPFHKWWGSTGQKFASDVAFKIGNGIGSFFKGSLLFLLGMNTGTAAEDGLSIGASFADGFLQGFNPEKISQAIGNALKGVALSAGKVLPGGKSPTGGSWISAAILGYLGIKAGKGIGLHKLLGKGLASGMAGSAGSGLVAAGGTGAGRGMATGRIVNAARNADDYSSFWANASLWNATSRETVLAANHGVIRSTNTMAGKMATKLTALTQKFGMGFDDIASKLAPAVAKLKPIAGKVGKFAKGNALSLLFSGVAIAQSNDKVEETVAQTGGILGGIGGAALGKLIGAGIGTAVAGPVGTAVGGALGAIVGNIGGYMLGEKGGRSLSYYFKSVDEQKAIDKQRLKDENNQKINETISVSGKSAEASNGILQELDGLQERNMVVKDLAKQWNDVRWELNQGTLSAEDMAVKQAEMESIIGNLASIYPDIIDMSDTENQKLGDKLNLLKDIEKQERKRTEVALQSQILKNDKEFGNVNGSYFTAENKVKNLEGSQKVFSEKQDKLENLGLEFKTASTTYNSKDSTQQERQNALEREREILKEMREIASEIGISKKLSENDILSGDYLNKINERKIVMLDDLSEAYSQMDILKEQLTSFRDTELEAINLKVSDNLGMGIEEAAQKYDALSNTEKLVFQQAMADVDALNNKYELLKQPVFSDVIIRLKTDTSKLIFPPGIQMPSISLTQIGLGSKKGTDKQYATGGIVKKAHVGMIGEAGAEAIIPLTGTNKHRGIALWEQTGQILGTIPKHATGGIYGPMPHEIALANAQSIFNKKSPAEMGLANVQTVLNATTGGNKSNTLNKETKVPVSQPKPITINQDTLSNAVNGVGMTYDRLNEIADVTSKMDVHKNISRRFLRKLPKSFGIQSAAMKGSKQFSKTLNQIGKGFGKVGKKLPYLGTLITTASALTDLATSDNKAKTLVTTGGSMAGALAGAKLGALIGTGFAPGIGTAVGAIGGIILGAIGSNYGEKIAGAIYDFAGKEISEFKEKYGEFSFKNIAAYSKDKFSLFKGNMKAASLKNNYGGNFARYATGGIVNQAHVGMIGEAGAEAIIPLTGTNKHRGVRLWEDAGKILGTLPKHATGGIFGYSKGSDYKSMEKNEAVHQSNATPISVNMGGFTFTFNNTNTNDKEGIMTTIRNQMPEITNEIAETLSKILTQVFSNLKTEVEGI